MNVSLLHHLLNLIEEILRIEVPVVEKAAVATAVETAESDPKTAAVVAASTALLAGAQDLRTALNAQAPTPTPPPPPPAA